MRIHLLPETSASGPPWACAEIRLLRPYRHPLMRKHMEVSTGPRLPLDRVDAVVIQRALTPEASLEDAITFLRDVRRRGIKIIYDLDDDLLSQHPSFTLERGLMPSRPRIRLLLREADAVTVSTALLADRVRPLNPCVFVWPNAIDENFMSETRSDIGEKADIGYFGTMSHLGDLLAVMESLEMALNGLPARPEMELCGISDDPRMAGLFATQCKVRMLPVDGDYASFQTRLHRRTHWKTGLAPLTDNVFNLCKSDMKFLDYALAGIPSIYADCPAYAAVIDGETGLKVSLEGFGAAVLRLLQDHDLRNHIRDAARQYVLDHRTLRRCVPALLDVVKQVL